MAKRKTPRSDKPPSAAKRPRRRGKRPPPQFRNVVFCDHVIKDEFTGKISLIGTFNAFIFPRYPASPASFMIFAEITDALADFRLSMVIESIENNIRTPAFEVAYVKMADRMQSHFIALRLGEFHLPRPGKYDIVLYGDGEEVARSALVAKLVGSSSAS